MSEVRRLSDRLRRELTAALDQRGWRTALHFAEAVTLQVAYPLGGADAAASHDAESRAARSVLRLLGSPASRSMLWSQSAARSEPPKGLEADPQLVAAVFQNIDLLYRDGFPYADEVSNAVMNALSEMAETTGAWMPADASPLPPVPLPPTRESTDDG